MHPNRIRWCPALRSDEDVTIAVLNAHQWGLTDCTCATAFHPTDRTFGLRKTFDETKRRPPRLSSVEPFGALPQCRRPAWSKAAVVDVPATQSAVPLCSRSQAVIAASTAGSGCAQVILAKRGRQPASGAGLTKSRAVIFSDLYCGRQLHHRASRRAVHRIDLMLC